MSDVETAVDGALVAPVETAEVEQEQVQDTTAEQVDEQAQERDEKGRFAPVQKRINELTRNWREAERRAEAREQELEQYKRQPPATASQVEAAPTLEQYDFDHAKWTQALVEHASNGAVSKAEARLREQEAQRAHMEVAAKFDERSRAYAAQHPDYDKALAEMSGFVRFQPELVEAIGHSEKGPEVAHYLATHLDEADRISRLPVHLAAVQLGRIEAQVSASKPKPVTSAPNPPPMVGGASAASKNPDRMTTDEWMAWRRSQ